VKPRRISFLICGMAGDGIFASGTILSKTFMRGGLNVFSTNEYRSIIRGGYQWYNVTVSDYPVYSHVYHIDFLIALTKKAVEFHKSQLSESSTVIVDTKEDLESTAGNFTIVKVPMSDFLREAGAKRIMRNSIALGALISLVDYDFSLLESVIRDTYKEDVAIKNVELAKRGYEYINQLYSNHKGFKKLSRREKPVRRIFVSGNEAVALGAIAGGLKFYVAYPMTPASSILHFLARLQHDYSIIVLQPESEIAAINMVIGASFAGVRAMTATSGGGFSLMTEALGLAAMAETPIVIVVVQRPGPSTGMPTFTSQGDLRFVLHASQGEFPRIVLAPGDAEEAFHIAFYSLNLAWKFQIPVIILSDKFLGESSWSCKEFKIEGKVEEGKVIRGTYRGEQPYRRYALSKDGVSPFAILGTKNAIVKANSSEHDEYGVPTVNPQLVKKMVEKRFKKIEKIKEEMKKYEVVKYYGDPEPECLIISWGSLKGPILEAMQRVQDSLKVGFVQVLWLEPFPKNELKTLIEKSENRLLIENNKTGLLNSLLNEHLHINIEKKFLKYDGRPPYPYEIVKAIKGEIV